MYIGGGVLTLIIIILLLSGSSDEGFPGPAAACGSAGTMAVL